MDHAEEAVRLFYEGYNCAQAVFCAFRDETGMDLAEAAKLSSAFGGGIGRLREVCGAVSGALMAYGMLRGYADPRDPEAKIRHYAGVRAFAAAFSEAHGSVVCRTILKDVPVSPGGVPEARTPAFYSRRPCLKCIRDAAAILDGMLRENGAEAPEEG
ncbi:MAG: C_GCAxxG_C_C family protein [Lachnospiraceae bacterium]|nr:C_GCAxxG_C_C family protein [Lachnospiraceae bacterium]